MLVQAIEPIDNGSCQSPTCETAKLLRFRNDSASWGAANPAKIDTTSTGETSKLLGFGYGKSEWSKNPGGIITGTNTVVTGPDLPIAGDWNGFGFSNVGVARYNDNLKALSFLLSLDQDGQADRVITRILEKRELLYPVAGQFDLNLGTDVGFVQFYDQAWHWTLITDKASPVSDIHRTFGSDKSSRPIAGVSYVDDKGRQYGPLALATLQANSIQWQLTSLDGVRQTIVTQKLPSTANVTADNWQPIAGDWTGDGVPEFGVVVQTGTSLNLYKAGPSNSMSVAELLTNNALAKDRVLVGKWDVQRWSRMENPLPDPPQLPTPVSVSWDAAASWSGERYAPRPVPSSTEPVVIESTIIDDSVNVGSQVIRDASTTVQITTNIVDKGTLRLNNETKLSVVNVRSGGKLELNGAGTTESLTAETGSTVIVNNDNASIAELKIRGGVVEVVKASSIQTITIEDGGILRMQGNVLTTGAITINGGKIELETDAPFGSATPINVRFGGAMITAKVNRGVDRFFRNGIVLNPGATLTFNVEADSAEAKGFQFGGVISGNGTFRKEGSGFLNLLAQPTFTGAIEVKQGELRLSRNDLLPANVPIQIDADATLNLESNQLSINKLTGQGSVRGIVGSKLTVDVGIQPITFAGQLTGGLAFSKTGSGTFTLTGRSTNTGPVTIGRGILKLDVDSALSSQALVSIESNDATQPAELNVAANGQFAQLTLTGNGASAQFGTINKLFRIDGDLRINAGSRLNAGAGRLQIRGDLINRGNFQPEQGTLEMVGAAQLLDLDNSDLNSLQHAGTGLLSVRKADNKLKIAQTLRNTSGDLDLSNVTVEASRFELIADEVRGSAAINVSTLAELSSGIVQVSITGTGSLSKIGSRSVELGRINSYSGSTSASDGILITTQADTIPSASPVMLDKNARWKLGGSQNLTSLTGEGEVELVFVANKQSANLKLTIAPTVPLTFAGRITGTGNLTVAGGGTLILTSANTLTGTTTVENGTLQLGTHDALSPNSPVVIAPAGRVVTNGFQVTVPRIDNKGILQIDTGLGLSINGDLISDANSQINGGAKTVQVSGRLQVAGTFHLDGSTVTANSLLLSGGQLLTKFDGSLIVVNTTVDFEAGTVAVPIKSNGNVRKTTEGTLTISKPLSHTGETSVEGGILDVSVASGLPATSLVRVFQAAQLKLAGSVVSLAGLDNAGTVNFNADGSTTLSLSGLFNNSINGKIFGKSLAIQVGGNFTNSGLLQGDMSLELIGLSGEQIANPGSNSTWLALVHRTGSKVVLGSDVQVEGRLEQSGSGAIELNGRSITLQELVLDGGSITNSKTTGHVIASRSNAFKLRGGNVDATMSGRSGITVSDGSVSIRSAQTYEGSTNVTTGKLTIASTGTLPNSTRLEIGSGGSVELNDQAQSIAGLIGSGSLKLGQGNLNISSDEDSSFGGNITGSGGITKSGSGRLVLTAKNEYAGSTTIAQGALVTTIANALPTSSRLTVNTPASLILSNASQQFSSLDGDGAVHLDDSQLSVGETSSKFAGVISGTGSLKKVGTGVLTLTGVNLYGGKTLVEDGTLSQGVDNALPEKSAVFVAAKAQLDFASFSARVASIDNLGQVRLGDSAFATIDVTGTFRNAPLGKVIGGSATLRLAGDLDNSGDWPADNQKLILIGTNDQQRILLGTSVPNDITLRGSTTVLLEGNLQSRSLNLEKGSLELNGKRITLDTFTLVSGNVTSTLAESFISSTQSYNLQNGSIGVSLRGPAGLTKTTAGSVDLSGDNRFTGPIDVKGGSLRLLSATALPSNAWLSISADGMVDAMDHSYELASLTGAGLVKLGTAMLTIGNSAAVHFEGVLEGSGGLIKGNTGTLTLSGNNSYSGPTHVMSGTVSLGNSNALPPSSRIIIDASGNLDLGAFSQTTPEINGRGRLTLANGQMIVQTTSTKQTFAGSIEGTGKVTKQGPGGWQLTGSGSYAGTIEVEAGTLLADGQFPLASTSVQADSALQGNGTLGDVVIQKNGSLRPGNSPGRLSVNNLTLDEGSTLVIELAGTQPTIQYDQIQVRGLAILNGIIDVKYVDNFTPPPSSIFEIVLFQSSRGSPVVLVPSFNGLGVLRPERTPSSLRLVYNIVTPGRVDGPPTITVPSGSGGEDFGPAQTPALAAGSTSPHHAGRVDVPVEYTKELQYSDDMGWLEQPPELVPLAIDDTTPVPPEKVAIDATYADSALMSLQSITSDQRPFAEEELGLPIKPPTDVTPNISDAAPSIWFTVAGGLLAIGGVISLFASTLMKEESTELLDEDADDDAEVPVDWFGSISQGIPGEDVDHKARQLNQSEHFE